MSGKISGMVWDLDLPHPELLVLLAITDHANHDGRNMYPGVALLAGAGKDRNGRHSSW